jgi:hypothetical protein
MYEMVFFLVLGYYLDFLIFDLPRTSWSKFTFIPFKGLDEEDFQRFPFFNQSEVVTTILDVGQGHRRHF